MATPSWARPGLLADPLPVDMQSACQLTSSMHVNQHACQDEAEWTRREAQRGRVNQLGGRRENATLVAPGRNCTYGLYADCMRSVCSDLHRGVNRAPRIGRSGE